jgi:AGZA family xanthine/uracil permease-like MFS transporter
MAYIIAVNLSIVADIGGTCICNGGVDDLICENNTEYVLCLNEIKRDLITATAAISSIATFCMGLFANL